MHKAWRRLLAAGFAPRHGKDSSSPENLVGKEVAIIFVHVWLGDWWMRGMVEVDILSSHCQNV